MNKIGITVEIVSGDGSFDAEQLQEDLSQLRQDLLEVPGIEFAELPQPPGPPGTRGIIDIPEVVSAIVVFGGFVGKQTYPITYPILNAVRSWIESHSGKALRFTFGDNVQVKISGPWSESDRQKMIAWFREVEESARLADLAEENARIDLPSSNTQLMHRTGEND
jgi:hypothetical protein